MKTNRLLYVFLGLLFLSACESDSKQTSVESEAAKEVAAFDAGTDRIPPADLAKVLPDAMLGMPKTTGSSGTPKLKDGTAVSMARRVFRNGEKELTLELRDIGVLDKTMGDLLSWSNKSVHTINGEKVENNFQLDGFPAYEKYDIAASAGAVHVLPNKRMEIILRGKNVSLDDMKNALQEWDIANSISSIN